MRRVLLAFLALLLLSLLGVGWYTYQRGFTKRWRNQVTDEFRQRGVEVSLRRLTLDPFRGLVAKEVRVFEAKDRRRTLAVVDEMVLEVNYANLIRGQTFLDALDLRDANLSLPVDPTKPKGPLIEISRLNARLFLPPQQIYLAHAEAEIFGLHVSASGRLINPQAFHFKSGSGDTTLPGELAGRIVEEIKALNFGGGAPMLDLTFQGDLAQPDQVLVELTLWGERIRRQNYFLQNLYLTASYRNGVIDLKKFTASDLLGTLDVSGSYRPVEKTADLRIHSDLDIQGLAGAFKVAPQISEFVFYTPPRLDLAASANFGDQPGWQITGHLGLQKFAAKSVIFNELTADFAWAVDRWTVREFHLVHPTGEVTADVLQLPGDIRAHLKSTINPKALQPLFTGVAFDTLERFEFADAPQIEFTARGREISRDALVVSGKLQTGAGSYRGVAAEKIDADFHYEDRQLHFAPFHVQRAEGGGGGGLTFDFRTDEVRLEKIRGSVYPPEVALWIDPNLVKDIAPYRFKPRPPNLFIDGLVHTKGGKSTHLVIDIDAPGGMDYTFLKKDLRFPEIAGKLLFTSDRLRISDLAGTLFGGRVKGDADISLVRDKPSHRANIQMENVDFQSLSKLYFNYDGSQGRLSGHYDFTGRGADARTMEGRGDLAVTNGNVFAIPFLGPFSGILESIVPGMGYNVARRATTTFSIRDGVIDTNNLVVEGSGFSMYGGGKLFYLDDRMNFDMRINAQGLPGVLLFPVSKLFEYTADEKLSKPTWRSKVVPKF